MTFLVIIASCIYAKRSSDTVANLINDSAETLTCRLSNPRFWRQGYRHSVRNYAVLVIYTVFRGSISFEKCREKKNPCLEMREVRIRKHG